MKKRNLILVSIILVILVFSVWWYLQGGQLLSREAEVDTELVEGITDVEETSGKMYEFIYNRLPESDVFLKFEIGEHAHLSIEELRREPLAMLQTAIQQAEPDILTVAVTSQALQEVFDGVDSTDFEGRVERVRELLETLNRKGTFTSLTYQFEHESFNVETNEGILYLNYSDGSSVETPFEVVLMGEGEERMGQLELSLSRMETKTRIN